MVKKKSQIEQSSERVEKAISSTSQEAQKLTQVIEGIGNQINKSIQEALEGSKLLNDSGQALADTFSSDILLSISSTTKGMSDQLAIQTKINKGESVSKQIKDKLLANEAKKQTILKRIAAAGDLISDTKKEELKDAMKMIDLDSNIMKSLSKQSKEFGNQKNILKTIGESIANVANQIDKSGLLADVLTGNFGELLNFTRISELGAASMVATLVDGLTKIDQVTTSFSQNFGLTTGQARELNREMMKAADSSGRMAITFEDTAATITEMSQQVGFLTSGLSNETVAAAASLRKELGLSVEGTTRLALNANRTGIELEKQDKLMARGLITAEKQLGVNLDGRAAFKAVSELTGIIRANMGRNYQEMIKTVGAAQALGLTMQDLANIGESMLNFQSSIEAELTAELFLGKQLNLEKARLYALTGDYGNLQKEIVSQLGSEYEFLKLNTLQKKKYAEALGMSVDQMSNLVMAEADLNSLKDQAVARGDTELLNMLKQRELQEKLADIIAKVQTAFISMAEGPIGNLVEGFAKVLESATAVKAIIIGMAGIKLMGLIGSAVSLAGALGLTATGAAYTVGILTGGALLAIAMPSILSMISSFTSTKRKATSTPSLQGLPEGDAAHIRSGEVNVHAGETVINTSDFGKIEVLLEELIFETKKNKPNMNILGTTVGRFR